MSTYQMRNTNRWLCPNCGRQKDAKAKLCAACFSIEHARNIPDEETLLKTMKALDWNFSAIGRHYGVSDNAVRKWCRKYGLPDRKEVV